jgi:hypothetical protein
MPVVPHSEDCGAEIAIADRARVARPVYRRYPEIEHVINGRAERNPGAIRTDPHDAPLGIAKTVCREDTGSTFGSVASGLCRMTD